jgi:EAL domain-containing protein (putative c-di-GMP-specific phosphodiesterase class I)
MYLAKQAGRNNYQFFEADGRDEVISRRFKLENQLRRALERGEMSLVYQPEVDLESGRINGMEALLRWRHPELGDIPPDEFIPVAEDIGLIGAVGVWSLREACRQNKAWQTAGHPAMCMSVNLSAGQLRDRRLVETVAEILAETGLEGRWLELELTEASLTQNIDESLSRLTALKGLGVRLSIDDFGTGRSCLSYLSRMPVDTLKIDRSFIANMASNTADAAISRTIVTLANNLNLKVVAEGVESIEQFKILREFQCCDAQGFYFSHPLTPESFNRLLSSDDPHQRIAALQQS